MVLVMAVIRPDTTCPDSVNKLKLASWFALVCVLELLDHRLCHHGSSASMERALYLTAFEAGSILGQGSVNNDFAQGTVMTVGTNFIHRLHDQEMQLLLRLREVRRAKRQPDRLTLSLGNRVADAVAATVGSWGFIIIQSVLLAIWIALNITAYVNQWDPYPFILLNLALSFRAAYTAPILMTSQNRQAMIDREHVEHDYQINVKAELEIELLHQKIDQMRETEVLHMIGAVRELQTELRAARGGETAN
jgi:uncharacterized membrane protein